MNRTRGLSALALCCAFMFASPLFAEDFPRLPQLPMLPDRDAIYADQPVVASLSFDVSEITPGSAFTASLTLTHVDGWHTYSDPAGDAGLPTSVEWSLGEVISAGDIEWPAPREFDDRGVKSFGYDGTVTLKIPMRADASLRTGTTVRLDATVRWLACKVACEPGSASFGYELPVGEAVPSGAEPRASTANGAAGNAGAAKLLLAIVGAFLGGLILNLMPCVLPVLSLKLHSLILQSGSSRRASIRNALAYALGILVSFWALAAILSALKAGGSAIGWGFQFQNPRFVAVMAIFFMAFALNMLGVFEIGEGAEALASKAVPSQGLPRAFMSGVVATVAATPCTAPFMGAAIAYALSASPIVAFLVFGSMGAGLAAPIVLLSLMPSLASRLPKAGRWMETLKQILGFFLLGTVLWLISIVTKLAGSPIPALSGLLVAGVAAWVWGRWGTPTSNARGKIAGRAVATILFVASVAFSALLTGRAQETADARSANERADSRRASGIQWEAWSASRLDELRAEGKTVFVDFRADWCLTCVANEIAVLGRKTVADEFARLGVVALKADWTKADPEITRALAAYGRSSVPLYLVFTPGREDPAILPEILTERIVLNAILMP